MTLYTSHAFDHVTTMTDERGMFEHAEHDRPRHDHGYCTDDNARLLLVVCRETDGAPIERLCRIALSFTLAAQGADGRTRNRMDVHGRWTDTATTDDCWGRSLWGLGTAAAHHADPAVRAIALEAFTAGARRRSPWTRAMAFAGLGAAEVLAVAPRHERARAVLRTAALRIGRPAAGDWRWPQERLRYANAALPEVLLAAGAALDEPEMLADGLVLLDWLLTRQTRRGHLSVTGTAGSDRNTHAPQFDQQPIEVAAIADACARAHRLTGDRRWAGGVRLAANWFDGDNDAGAAMWDPRTGSGYDGLERSGVNRNQGAESTLALISTRRCALELDAVSA